ncbi:Membrane-bound lytic murein transglycosylase C [subsurface metagenome]
MKPKTLGWIILGGGIILTLFLLRSRIHDIIEDREVRIFLNRLSPYHPIVTDYADQHSLDENLVKAVIWTESSGFPDAEGPYGEIGFMQVFYTTAQQMGFTGEPDELFDPDTNVYYGTKYLRWQLDRYGQDIQMALSAYEAGTYTPENKWYVDRVLGYYARLEAYLK